MANADSSRLVTVKSARSAPLSIETAASCAETVATNTQKSSVLLLLRPAALAVLPRGILWVLWVPIARTLPVGGAASWRPRRTPTPPFRMTGLRDAPVPGSVPCRFLG